jgi:hypothetical protein
VRLPLCGVLVTCPFVVLCSASRRLWLIPFIIATPAQIVDMTSKEAIPAEGRWELKATIAKVDPTPPTPVLNYGSEFTSDQAKAAEQAAERTGTSSTSHHIYGSASASFKAGIDVGFASTTMTTEATLSGSRTYDSSRSSSFAAFKTAEAVTSTGRTQGLTCPLECPQAAEELQPRGSGAVTLSPIGMSHARCGATFGEYMREGPLVYIWSW